MLLDEDEEGNLTPVVAHGDDGVSANAMAAARRRDRILLQQPMSPQPQRPQKKAGDEMPPHRLCRLMTSRAVMLSATGLIARTSEDAVERWENRSASDGRAKDDPDRFDVPTSTRSSYGLVT